MIISLIAAMDENSCIGKDNDLPWGNLPRDKKRFRDLTMGKPVVMGRKTFESIGKPLPKRRNIILTRNPNYKAPKGCEVVHSVDKVLELLECCPEVMIIGGAAVYQAFLPYAQRIYLTEIEAAFEGDTYFPDLNLVYWIETERVWHGVNKKNPYSMRFITLEWFDPVDLSQA